MPSPLRDGMNWSRELEQGLPDCRLAGVPTVVLGRQKWERVFCANCGADGGLVTAEWTAHVFYQCEPCALKLGPIPGVDKVPDAVVAANNKPGDS